MYIPKKYTTIMGVTKFSEETTTKTCSLKVYKYGNMN